MSRLNPDKLTVEYRGAVSETEPVIPRRYTLTHSDLTADLYLTLAPEFAYDKLNAMRDEVLGEWVTTEAGFLYYVYLQAEGQNGIGNAAIRREIFRRELPLALEAIRYGDRVFFEAHPGSDQIPIIAFYLYSDPEQNEVTSLGTFADYNITADADRRELSSDDPVEANTLMEHKVLIDEWFGDVNGDGVPDRVRLYGDRSPSSELIHSIILEIESGSSEFFKVSSITEVNAYHPTLFLGDFTRDGIEDVMFRADMIFNSMNAKDPGHYGIAIYTFINKELKTIFESERYNHTNSFLVEYRNGYKLSITNVSENKLFFLDLIFKGKNYLSEYYDEQGNLKRPVQGRILPAEAFLPVSSEIRRSYDLLAVHRIIGETDQDILGYLENLLSWDVERFISVRMMACTPGTIWEPKQEAE